MSDIRVILLLADGATIETEMPKCECGGVPKIAQFEIDGKETTLALDIDAFVYRQMPEDFMGGEVPSLCETVRA